MIRFGLRLTLSGGREAVTRLVIIAAAVALGVGMLLACLAGINAVNSQNARYAWLNTNAVPSAAAGSSSASAPAADPLWWFAQEDYFRLQIVGRFEVAATGPHAPVPPGIPRLPGPGEFYASPALSALLRSTPSNQLGDRFPGREVGTIDPAGLPAPNSLIIVIGRTVEQLSHQADATKVTSIMATVPSSCDNCFVGINANGIDLILSVVALALVFPVFIFIGTATRLSATRREQRFAAMRLVGATPRQIAVIAAVESTVAAIVGTAVGFALFLLFSHPLAAVPFTGSPFFPGDMALNLPDVASIAFGVPVIAAVAARLALRRVQISPLGVSRRVTPRPPRAYRLIPLVAGILELSSFLDRRPRTTNGQLAAYLTGITLIMVGLVIAGPWLTMLGSRFMARRASRPATLIAGRRLSDNPKAGFRAISGLILALFITSVATGVITTFVANRGSPPSGSVNSSALVKSFYPHELAKGQTAPSADAVPIGLSSIPGVHSVTVVFANPNFSRDQPTFSPPQQGLPTPPSIDVEAGVISCAELARTPAFGSCEPGATVAQVPSDFLPSRQSLSGPQVWATADVDVESLQRLPVLSVVAYTDGSAAAIEQARTAMEIAFPQRGIPRTDADFEADTTRLLFKFQQLANVVVLTSLVVAGCSLAVSVAGGIAERKRPFSLLRLTGAPPGILRRVVALESTVPLLIAAVVACAAGFLAAGLFVRSELHYALRPPGIGYYLIVLAGLAASLAIIAATLPLLNRITGPETARSE